jgi:choline dehydrogenase-like flavoprotein
MIVDARSVPAGTLVETDVCIIGAGAAGITIAREFSDAPFRVVLLESGGMEYEPETQELYQGLSVGQPFPDLTASRLRFFGGTTNHWGGWSSPFEEIDFEARDDLPYHDWPFPKTHLDPWYRRAQDVCQLGPFDYRPARWGISSNVIPPPFSGPHFECKIIQENPLRFGPVYGPEVQRAPSVTVYLHANASHLDGGETGSGVREVSVKTLSGTDFAVRARHYILAAGGVENARLLLASGQADGNGLGNAHDLVGRFFMVHLIYSGGMIVPSDPHMNFDFRTAGYVAGQRFVSFIGLSESSMRLLRLPNIRFFWDYQFSPVVKGVKALRRLMGGEGPGGGMLADLSAVIGDLDGVVTFAARKVLFGEGIPIEALPLVCNWEQQANPQSRVFLGSERDRIGMREIVVDWQLTDGDKITAAAGLRLLGTEIGRAGFGRLRSSLTEDDPWPGPEHFYGDEHHMGTTRMHQDPTLGVVDENCRVHGVANLYVAGSSVFPTGSAHNPTLTIVALALRLADHVKKQMI